MNPEPPPLVQSWVIAGFWQRIAAVVIDFVVLSVPAHLAGAVLFDFFASLGSWGRLVGLPIAVLYLGLGDSVLYGGQTIGKRVMKIRVVGQNGTLIPFGRSLLRAAVLGVPLLLNGMAWPSSSAAGHWIAWLPLIVGGWGTGALYYFFIFNRRTRQSLHDLAAKTYVVKDASTASSPPVMWQGHWAILAVLGLASLAAIPLGKMILRWGPFATMTNVASQLEATGKIRVMASQAGDIYSLRTDVGAAPPSGAHSSFYSVTAAWKKRPQDYETSAVDMAEIVMANYPKARNFDVLNLTVAYGYDIGIASWWTKITYSKSPAQWSAEVESRARHRI